MSRKETPGMFPGSLFFSQNDLCVFDGRLRLPHYSVAGRRDLIVRSVGNERTRGRWRRTRSLMVMELVRILHYTAVPLRMLTLPALFIIRPMPVIWMRMMVMMGRWRRRHMMMVVMLMVAVLIGTRSVRPAVTGAAITADTWPDVDIVLGGISCQSIIPTDTSRISSRRPVAQELQLVDVTHQSSFTVHIWIARPATGPLIHRRTIEDIVAQQIILHDHRDGTLIFEQSGVNGELLRYGDLIDRQCAQCDMPVACNMVDRPAETFSNLFDKRNAAQRCLRSQHEIALCGLIRCDQDLKLHDNTSFLGGYASRK